MVNVVTVIVVVVVQSIRVVLPVTMNKFRVCSELRVYSMWVFCFCSCTAALVLLLFIFVEVLIFAGYHSLGCILHSFPWVNLWRMWNFLFEIHLVWNTRCTFFFRYMMTTLWKTWNSGIVQRGQWNDREVRNTSKCGWFDSLTLGWCWNIVPAGFSAVLFNHSNVCSVCSGRRYESCGSHLRNFTHLWWPIVR